MDENRNSYFDDGLLQKIGWNILGLPNKLILLNS